MALLLCHKNSRWSFLGNENSYQGSAGSKTTVSWKALVICVGHTGWARCKGPCQERGGSPNFLLYEIFTCGCSEIYTQVFWNLHAGLLKAYHRQVSRLQGNGCNGCQGVSLLSNFSSAFNAMVKFPALLWVRMWVDQSCKMSHFVHRSNLSTKFYPQGKCVNCNKFDV